MPRGRSYGDKLRIARERAGLDVVTLAKRLHVRPDILKAIENADFERMPARGYTRNMIRAYARQVGLNEKELSEMYLDEVHLFETGTPRLSRSSRDSYSRNERPPARFADDRVDRYSSSRTLGSRDPYARDYGRLPSRNLDRTSRRQSVSLYDDRPSSTPMRDDRYPRGRNDSQSIRFVSSPSRRFEDASGGSRASSRDRYSQNLDAQQGRRDRSRSINFSGAPNNDRSSRRRPITLTQSSHSYSDLYSNSNSRSKVPELNMPLIIIIAVVAIAIILAVVVLFNSTTQSAEEIPDIPIAGYSDTSNPETQIDPIASLPEPTSAKFTYSVEAGERSYIEIYENGSSKPLFSGVVTGPATETYDVSGTLTFEAANPTPVSVKVDDEEVKLTKNPQSGYYSYTVDFAAILAAWRSENDPNGSAPTDTSGNTNSATNTNTATNSTSSGNRSSNNASSSSNTSTR